MTPPTTKLHGLIPDASHCLSTSRWVGCPPWTSLKMLPDDRVSASFWSGSPTHCPLAAMFPLVRTKAAIQGSLMNWLVFGNSPGDGLVLSANPSRVAYETVGCWTPFVVNGRANLPERLAPPKGCMKWGTSLRSPMGCFSDPPVTLS